jgi:ketosteroid isomerase-like protein
MSEENVAIVRRLFELFDGRDHERAFEYYDPEVEFDATAFGEVLPELARVYHGHDGVRTYWREWLFAWSDIAFELEDVVDAGDEVVGLVRNQRMWGRHSGIEIEMPPYAIVFTLREGKVVRWRSFPDQESGLAAAGVKR